jgi:hypothetical protein
MDAFLRAVGRLSGVHIRTRRNGNGEDHEIRICGTRAARELAERTAALRWSLGLPKIDA